MCNLDKLDILDKCQHLKINNYHMNTNRNFKYESYSLITLISKQRAISFKLKLNFRDEQLSVFNLIGRPLIL